MKLLRLKSVVAVIGVFCVSCSLHAVQITGGISLAGGYITDTGDLNTATAFTSFTSVNVPVGGLSGSYLAPGVNLSIATPGSIQMNGFSFSPFTPVIPLWLTVGTQTAASFDLSDISWSRPAANMLVVTGNGMLYLAGFEATRGTWVFSANQAGGTFSFSSSNAAVPDGGTTALLLGSALAGVALLRRKLG